MLQLEAMELCICICIYSMVWYGINLFDITEIHNTLL